MRNASTRLCCKQVYIAFYQLVIKWEVQSIVGRDTLWGWWSWILSRLSNPQEQASKLYPCLATASAPASRFLPCLSSIPDNDELRCARVSRVNPVLCKLLLANCSIAVIVAQTKIPADAEDFKQLRRLFPWEQQAAETR